MGCGCKGKKVDTSGSEVLNDDKKQGFLSKSIEVIILSTLLIILSPILLILIWVIGISGIIKRDVNVVGYLLNKYVKYEHSNGNSEVNVNDIMSDSGYELLDVDVIESN